MPIGRTVQESCQGTRLEKMGKGDCPTQLFGLELM